MPHFLSKMPTASVPKRGFNLVEAAIVLGIVGLVIGGIWVAASAVYSKHRVSRVLSFASWYIPQCLDVGRRMPAVYAGYIDIAFGGVGQTGPGNFQYYPAPKNFFYDGEIGSNCYVNATGIYVSVYFAHHLYESDELGINIPDACIALSQHMLKLWDTEKEFQIISYDYEGTYTINATMHAGEAKPTLSELTAACKNAEAMDYLINR